MFISDFMEKIIKIPDEVEVNIKDFKVSVKGPRGSLERDFFSPLYKEIRIKKNDKNILVFSESEKRKIKSMVGTITSHIKNMIKGVTKGYVYKLKIVYIHFPFTVKVSDGEVLISNFLGEKAPRKSKIVGETKVEVKGDEIIVTGINKEDTGQTAVNIERATKISRRDRRVFQDGIFLVGSE